MEFRIRYRDTDSTGRIFFTNYLEFFDDAILEFFRERGVTFTSLGNIILDSMAKDEIFVVGDCHCRFLNETFYDDVLEATPKIEEFGEKKLVFQIIFYNKTREKVCANGNITLICLRASTKVSTTIPPDLVSRLSG